MFNYHVLNTEAGSTLFIVLIEKKSELPIEIKSVMVKSAVYSASEYLIINPEFETPRRKPSRSIAAIRNPAIAKMSDCVSISRVIYPFVAPIAFKVP